MEETNDLINWLETYDAESRAVRAMRLRELLDIYPEPSENIGFLGSEESLICYNEVKRCYLEGAFLAVVLLCVALFGVH